MRLIAALTFLLGAAQGFAPQAHRRSHLAPLQSADPKAVATTTTTTTTTDDDAWIKAGFESQVQNDVIRGPSQVLIYDTTLRGTFRDDDKLCRCGLLLYSPIIPPITHLTHLLPLIYRRYTG